MLRYNAAADDAIACDSAARVGRGAVETRCRFAALPTRRVKEACTFSCFARIQVFPSALSEL